MNYKISICHPDKEDIEKPDITLNKQQVVDFFSKYPWMQQIDFASSMPQEQVPYSPSIRFTNIENKRALELTAGKEKDILVFSLWYERPVMVKILFGLLGTTKMMRVVDKFSFDMENSLKHLNTFLNENYDELEKVMNE